MEEFVVIDVEGRFLAGPRYWSAEYPDALVFARAKLAVAAATRAGVLCEVVADYGVETQRTIETVG